MTCSGGGGTGSSSVDTMVNLMYSTGKPVGVIYVLPKETEDVQSKANSIQFLARLASMAESSMISSLIVVDNARIEQIYGGLVKQNFGRCQTEHSCLLYIFNTLTASPLGIRLLILVILLKLFQREIVLYME